MRDGQGTGRRIVPKLRTTLFAAGGILTAGALIVVGTSLASALSSGASFRTATAESATVTETVNANGTVASATRRDLAFQTGGTVERVRVSVGDTVAAGDTLAVLDRSELEEAIADAEQAVADAEQTLAEHQEAQATGTTDTSATVSSSTAVSSTAVSNMTTSNTVISNAVASNAAVRKSAVQNTAATVDPAVTEARTKVTDAQEAMLTEYTRVQGEIDTTDGLIATASETCRVFLHAALAAGDDDSSGGDGSGGAAEDPGTDPGTAAGMTLEEAQAALAACQAEITTVQAAQVSIGEGQQRVQDLAAELDDAVDDLLAALETDDGSTSGGSGSGDDDSDAGERPSGGDSGGETPGGASGGASDGSAPGGGSSDSAAGGSTATITAEQLLADQAAIAAAEAELKIARAQLALAELTSPVDGRVAAVSLAEGNDVTAGSDSSIITVIGEDGYLVETTVSLTDIGKLEVGQTGDVAVAATGTAYPGEVSSIGVIDQSSTGTPAFSVTVALDTGEDELLNGGSARLGIETAVAESVLTVPTSAVHRNGNVATVNVLRDGESTAVGVETGAVGAERTEIRSGIDPGTTVILADLAAAIDGGESDAGSGGLTGLSGSGVGAGAGPGGGSFPGGGSMPGPPSGGFPGQ